MTTTATIHLFISGRVQGVGYRAWTQSTARKLALTGWVRNLTDGRVEAVVQGHPDAVDQLISDCQSGPPLARVTSLDTQPLETSEIFRSFEERDTATLER
jgi:acylphosphatase